MASAQLMSVTITIIIAILRLQASRGLKTRERAMVTWPSPVTALAMALTEMFPEVFVPGMLITGGTHGSEEASGVR